MRARLLSALVAAAVAMTMVWVTTAPAQTAVPDVVQVEDPINDANWLNDQDNTDVCDPPPCQGDQDVGDNSTVSDFLKAWYSHTQEEISLHILTQGPPPATTTIYYRAAANPSEADVRGCLNFRAVFPGQATVQGQVIDTSTYRGAQFAEFEDTCNAPDELVAGKITIEAVAEGGLTTLTFPRSASPLLADGQVITGTYLLSRFAAGAEGVDWVSAVQADNTVRGTDYTLTAAPQQGPKKCPSKGKKKGKNKPRPRPSATPTGSPTPTAGQTTPPGPEMMFQTPTPTSSATAKPTAAPGQQKPCPRQKGKNKPKPRPRPTGATTTPAPSPTATDS